MESDSWARISSSSYRRYQSRLDSFHGEEHNGDEELRAEFLCPFCGEDFDMVGLCCHIDEEHALEAKNGVCPVCVKKVGSDLVCHMTVQHGSLLKVQRRRRLRKGVSNLSFSSLRRDLREGKLQSLLGGSSFLVPPSHVESDPLVTSFICSSPMVHESPNVNKTLSSVKSSLSAENTDDKLAYRAVHQSPLSEEDQREAARKCEFTQGLLLSTFLDDDNL